MALYCWVFWVIVLLIKLALLDAIPLVHQEKPNYQWSPCKEIFPEQPAGILPPQVKLPTSFPWVPSVPTQISISHLKHFIVFKYLYV